MPSPLQLAAHDRASFARKNRYFFRSNQAISPLFKWQRLLKRHTQTAICRWLGVRRDDTTLSLPWYDQRPASITVMDGWR